MAAKSSKAFQRFLLKRGVIDEAALQEVESMKDDMNISLGVVAMNRGLLTSEQIGEILAAKRKTKKRFGQAALHLKFLTRAQLRDLLAEQEQVNLDVGELLVLTGHLSFEQLQKERRAFSRAKK